MKRAQNITTDMYMYELELEDKHQSFLVFHQVYRLLFNEITDRIAEFEEPAEVYRFVCELAEMYVYELENYILNQPISDSWKPYFEVKYKSGALQLLSGTSRHISHDYSYLIAKNPYFSEADLNKIGEIQKELKSQVVEIIKPHSKLVRFKIVQRYGYRITAKWQKKAERRSLIRQYSYFSQ